MTSPVCSEGRRSLMASGTGWKPPRFMSSRYSVSDPQKKSFCRFRSSGMCTGSLEKK